MPAIRSPKRYPKPTAKQLKELATVIRKRTQLDLYGHGQYLSVRKDISMNINHIDELAQMRVTSPFQAVPIARDEDTAALAMCWNLAPVLLAEVNRLTRENTRLKMRDDTSL